MTWYSRYFTRVKVYDNMIASEEGRVFQFCVCKSIFVFYDTTQTRDFPAPLPPLNTIRYGMV